MVALKVSQGQQPKAPESYKIEDLVTYAQAKNSYEPKPYIASVLNARDLENNEFVLGDGTNTSLFEKQKRRSLVNEFYNGPLEPTTSYSIFQRIFVEGKVYKVYCFYKSYKNIKYIIF